MKNLNVAVIGATGMVGQNILKVLAQRNFPIKKLYCFASEKNAGKILDFKERSVTVEALKDEVFNYPIDNTPTRNQTVVDVCIVFIANRRCCFFF